MPRAILPEVDYLVAAHLGAKAQEVFLDDLADSAFSVEWGRDEDLAAARRICTRYRSLRIGLVDAAVIATAERLKADAIATLDRDRAMLESISDAAWRYVAATHNMRERTDAYQDLFARYRELRRPRPANVVVPYGSRLDRPWIPNVAVRTVRSMIRRAKGKPY